MSHHTPTQRGYQAGMACDPYSRTTRADIVNMHSCWYRPLIDRHVMRSPTPGTPRLGYSSPSFAPNSGVHVPWTPTSDYSQVIGRPPGRLDF